MAVLHASLPTHGEPRKVRLVRLRAYIGTLAHPVCSLCSHPRRAEIDADLLGGQSTAAVAKKYRGQQTTFARHLRNHLKPHAHAIARAAGAMFLPPTPQAQAAALIPTVAAVLADLGHTVERLKTLADDAERDGGLARELAGTSCGLTDTAKLLAVLRPPDTPPPEQVDRVALADLIASTDTDSRQAILDKLVP
jgi:hypothetical protein